MNKESYKVVLVGDSSVGKTTMIYRAMQNKYRDDLNSTVAPNYFELNRNINGNIINLHVYDTAGQERYSSMNKLHYQGAQAVIIVYSFSDINSFLNVEKWYNDIFDVLKEDEVVVYLVANKLDLFVGNNDQSVESIENGQKKADDLGVQFMCTSAKSGKNIDDLFDSVGNLVNQKFSECEHSMEVIQTVDITQNNNNNNGQDTQNEPKKQCCS